MKLITFVGILTYEVTTYHWKGFDQTTKFFSSAAASFINPDEVVICATKTVRDETKNYNLVNLLQELGEKGFNARVLDIPDGKEESELWQIFEILANEVQDGEEIAFDITNSFRSLPFLVFLIIAYLKSAKSVNVKTVLYGMFERNTPAPMPVFDLSPFISLLDWITATDQFTRTGDGRWLAEMIRTPANKNAAKLLNEISSAAALCQVFSLMEKTPELLNLLQDIKPQPQPFNIINQKVQTAFSPFSVTDAKNKPADVLRAELKMIDWYHDSHQYFQMVTLGREWIIDAVINHYADFAINLDTDALQLKNRKFYEDALSGLLKVGGPKDDFGKFTEDDLNPLGKQIFTSEYHQILTDCVKLFDMRNRLDHAQHQSSYWDVKTILEKVAIFHQKIHELARLWQIAE